MEKVEEMKINLIRELVKAQQNRRKKIRKRKRY